VATERRPEGVSITFFARWRAKSVRPERNRTNLRRFDRHRTGRRPHSRARSNWSAVSFRVVLFLDTVEQSIGDFTRMPDRFSHSLTLLHGAQPIMLPAACAQPGIQVSTDNAPARSACERAA
jgi:hypothetical protein